MTKTNKDSPGISLCMIVRDEEFSLEHTLSVARPHLDQIVVVDTGSTDQTVSIAKNYADTIEHFDWIDDFTEDIEEISKALDRESTDREQDDQGIINMVNDVC